MAELCRLCVVFVHGNHGAAADWVHMEEQFRRALPTSTILYSSRCNQGRRTHDGILTLGRRLAEEVREQRTTTGALGTEDVRLVLVSHSLGGLIARAAIPSLLALDGITPLAYYSISTPHLGSRRPRGHPANTVKAWQWAVNAVVDRLYGQTGQDLMLQDPDTTLLQLARPPYVAEFSRFKVTLVSIPYYDILVPYCASAATLHHPYPELTHTQPFYVAGHSGLPPSQVDRLAELIVSPPTNLIDPPTEGGSAAEEVGNPVVATPSGLNTLTKEQTNDNTDQAGATATVGSTAEGGEVVYVTDTRHDVETLTAIVEGLAEVPFRRIDVQFNVPSRVWTHDAPLKKGVWNSRSAVLTPFLVLMGDLVALDAVA